MSLNAFSNSPDSIEAREFEQLIQDSIIAVKNGNITLAKKLLDQAALINSTDARIWIWLSATTDDLTERRLYLERAVAVDPSNATAKRGLLLVTEKLDKSVIKPEGESFMPSPPADQQPSPPLEASTRTYICPNCGATISYDVHDMTLVCQFCGYKRKVDEHVAGEVSDQVLDAILPTASAHRWAQNQARVTCEQCGVSILLPAGQTSDICPYCGANRFVKAAELADLIDPKVMGVFTVEPGQAAKSIKTWLGKGLLAPDDLAARHSGMQLHPAYYPFWVFSGTLEIPWFCDVNVGTSKLPTWEQHSGSQFENFDGLIVPGIKKLSRRDVTRIEPFNLNELKEFSPDFLPGWVALTYDLPLADASLQAREKIIKKVQPTLAGLVEPNHPKRNFSIGAGKWSGLTYKLALLPLYIGNYPFQGKRYQILINGQTGKVSGKKPIDTLKAIMLTVGVLVMLAVILAILSFVFKRLTG